MVIKYVRGDVLKAPQSLIVHQVNCQGVMGSGVAKAIKQKYPIVFKRYRELFEQMVKLSEATVGEFNSKRLLGITQAVDVDNQKTIVNLFSQDDYGYDGVRRTSYDAMEVGFRDIKHELQLMDIAMPRIGCGLGGGDWKIVSAIIESVFDDRNVYVYDLEEK